VKLRDLVLANKRIRHRAIGVNLKLNNRRDRRVSQRKKEKNILVVIVENFKTMIFQKIHFLKKLCVRLGESPL